MPLKTLNFEMGLSVSYAEAKEGDILNGKVTPWCGKDPSAEETPLACDLFLVISLRSAHFSCTSRCLWCRPKHEDLTPVQTVMSCSLRVNMLVRV